MLRKLFIIVMIVLGLFIAGCDDSKDTAAKDEENFSLQETTDNEPVKEGGHEIEIDDEDIERVKEVLISYNALQIYYDNYVGNLSYIVNEDLSNQEKEEVREILDTLLVEAQQKVANISKEAKEKLKTLNFDKQELDKYTEMHDEIVKQQEKWKDLILTYNKANGKKIYETIQKNTSLYLKKNEAYGKQLVVLLESKGLPNEEARTIATEIISEAVTAYGTATELKE